MTDITAYTRPSGVVVVQAHEGGRKVAEVTTRRSYPFLVVNLWRRPAGSGVIGVIGVTKYGHVVEGQVYDQTLTVYNGTGSRDTARRKRDRGGFGTVVLRRHLSDNTYSVDDDGWAARNTAKSTAAAEARWLAERDADRHQVILILPGGRKVRVGDVRRHFTFDQALARIENLPRDIVMVRSETDPAYADIPWATEAELAGVAAAFPEVHV